MNIFCLFFVLMMIFESYGSVNRKVRRKDDGFHFDDEPKHNLWYVEWWYFNWACENGLSGIYVYGVWNPHRVLDLGQSILYALHYKNDSVEHTSNLRGSKWFSASYEEANVTIHDTNTIRVITDKKYSVIGEARDSSTSWNFNITSLVDPWFFYENSSISTHQQLSWLVYMPQAEVSGHVFFDNEKYTLDKCHGYHDHDWGRWNAFTVTWAWVQMYDRKQKITVVGGAGQNSGEFSKANNIWMKYDGDGDDQEELFLKFTPDDCRVYYSKYTESEIPLHKYPAHVNYIATTENYHLNITYDVIMSPGIIKAAVFVFEQKSSYNGILTDTKTGKIIVEWKDVMGFSEWTDKAF